MRPSATAPQGEAVDLTIVHPMDPWKQGIGGFDTCIDGILRCAPPDWSIEVIGLSVEPSDRPVGGWLELPFADRTVRFFPVMSERRPSLVRRIPLVLRFVLACRRQGVRAYGKVIQFHRFESALGIRSEEARRMVYFIHNHPEEVRSSYSDVRWRRWWWPFYRLMAWKMRDAAAVVAVDPRSPAWVVRHFPWLDGVTALLPEWADRGLFTPGSRRERDQAGMALRRQCGLDGRAKIVAFVGRIERQKDPLFMLEAFAELNQREPEVILVVLGEGRMLSTLQRRAGALGLAQRTRFLTSIRREAMSDFYRAVDALVCTSRFDSGPRVVFEALACGTPVVSMNVGQVPDVLYEGMPAEVGGLVRQRDPRRFAETLQRTLSAGGSFAAARRCAAAVADFTPERSLADLFELYARWIGSAAPDVSASPRANP